MDTVDVSARGRLNVHGDWVGYTLEPFGAAAFSGDSGGWRGRLGGCAFEPFGGGGRGVSPNYCVTFQLL